MLNPNNHVNDPQLAVFEPTLGVILGVKVPTAPDKVPPVTQFYLTNVVPRAVHVVPKKI